MRKSLTATIAAALVCTAIAVPARAYTRNTAPQGIGMTNCGNGTAKVIWSKLGGKPESFSLFDGTHWYYGSMPNSSMSKGYVNVSWSALANTNPITYIDLTVTNAAGTATANGLAC